MSISPKVGQFISFAEAGSAGKGQGIILEVIRKYKPNIILVIAQEITSEVLKNPLLKHSYYLAPLILAGVPMRPPEKSHLFFMRVLGKIQITIEVEHELTIEEMLSHTDEKVRLAGKKRLRQTKQASHMKRQ